MGANIKYGALTFGVMMVVFGLAWIYFPLYPWAPLVTIWVGLVSLGVGFSKKFCC